MTGRRTHRGSRATTPVERAFVDTQPALKRFIGRFFRQGADVDDIAQETFLKAVAAEKRSPVRKPEAFLMTVARSVALTALSKKTREIADIVEDCASLEVSEDEPDAETQLIARERFAVFCDAVATLSPQVRKAFLLRKVKGLSHKEIASEMGISVSTVEKHLIAGLKRCDAYMQKHEEEETGARATRRAEAHKPSKRS